MDDFQLIQSKPNLFAQLKEQLQKDLQVSLTSLNLQQLQIELEKVVATKLTEDSQFSQQLYQVDLPEKRIETVLQSENATSELSQLILNREAQKVLFRFQYHQK